MSIPDSKESDSSGTQLTYFGINVSVSTRNSITRIHFEAPSFCGTVQFPKDHTGRYTCALVSTTNDALAAHYDTRAEMSAAVAAFVNGVMNGTSSTSYITGC